jgi:hypothetical protein
MSGTRADWAELLPLLQAFVAGAAVQKKDFDGRWVDTNEVYGVLTSVKYRLRPPKSRMGVWSRKFIFMEHGSVKGAIGSGTLRWEASATDTPKWPSHTPGMTLTGEDVFTPNEEPTK